jgi:hypothetical protein
VWRQVSGPGVAVEGCTATPGAAAEEAADAPRCALTPADSAAAPPVEGSCEVAAGSGGCAYVAPRGATLSWHALLNPGKWCLAPAGAANTAACAGWALGPPDAPPRLGWTIYDPVQPAAN